MSRYDIEQMKKDLKERVTEKRYNHCLMVADEAKKLAGIYKYDEEKAYVTGVIHDIAKDFSDEENERLVNKYKLDRKILDDDYKNVIHADIGAVFVKEKYDLDDDMCKAIKYHAIGNVDMDLLAKIIFIADKTGRKVLDDEIKKIKEISYTNLDKAILMFLEELAESLKRRGLKSQEETLKLYDKLKNETL